MPTVILLDVSLSMCQPVRMTDNTESYELYHLAVHGLTMFLDHVNINCRLEFMSLVAFSSQWEIIVQFTREFDTIKEALMHLEIYDKTSVLKALEGAQHVVMEEWGAGVPTQVILVTDGSTEVGKHSLKNVLERYTMSKDSDDTSFPLPFSFPCKLHIVCVNHPTSPTLQAVLPLYQKLIEINGGGGKVFVPEEQLSFKSIQQMFGKLTDVYYKPFHGVLSCGNLSSNVILSPPPELYEKAKDFEWVKAEMSPDISVCGFLDIGEVSSPPSLSRHLVLPIPINKEDNVLPVKQENLESAEEESSNEDSKQPSFCVLLHGSLKVEGMVAICQLGADWFGMLYSWADSKKKSNLMLSAFEPGLDSVPWLGNFLNIGPENADCIDIPTFPIKPSEKRSYAQNCVVWIKQSGLQADIQKILRHARKLPEKTQNFYKELNRLRRAALSFGFYELLEGMANILDRECTLLPGSAHPDAALQLTHSASALRGPTCQDFNIPVMPLRTKFSSDD